MAQKNWCSVYLTGSSFWWRLKFLFWPHTLTFAYSDTHWTVKGFEGFDWLSAGDLSIEMKREAIKAGAYIETPD